MTRSKKIKFRDAFDTGVEQAFDSSNLFIAKDSLKRIHTQVKQLEELHNDSMNERPGRPVSVDVIPAHMKAKLLALIAMKQDIEDLNAWCSDYTVGRLTRR